MSHRYWTPDEDDYHAPTRLALALALILWCAALLLLAVQIIWGVWS